MWFYDGNVQTSTAYYFTYRLIGLHLRVIMRMRNDGETEAYFLDSALFLGGVLIRDLRTLCNGWTIYVNVLLSDHVSDLRNNN
jgi:hypothetical protein